MPVVDLQEAKDVSQVIGRALEAPDLARAQQALQALFVERLDFDGATGTVPLHRDGLPPTAARIAQRDGVQVVAVQVPAKRRVLKQSLDRVFSEVRRSLAGDILLLATDGDRAQWHFVDPVFLAGKEILRRMVVYRGQPYRTVAQQVAGIYRETAAGGTCAPPWSACTTSRPSPSASSRRTTAFSGR